jgi:hypothetical protein
MPLIRDARTLSNKAICSLRKAMSTFNSYDDEGRVCSVLLHLQHACEMLLKAVLVQNKVKVFEEKSGKSISFEKCLRLCRQDHGLTEAEAGIMRTVDALRDAEQHWFAKLEEDVLYLHTRALITAFDAYIRRALDIDVRSRIPPRVLPVSTMPPGDFDFLVDREYKLIADLLKPGNRKRDEARARIRSLLAMEALVAEEVEISEKDINRIEKAIKDGSELRAVFPRLNTIASAVQGEGTAITVHFTKKEGAPVKFVGGDDPGGCRPAGGPAEEVPHACPTAGRRAEAERAQVARSPSPSERRRRRELPPHVRVREVEVRLLLRQRPDEDEGSHRRWRRHGRRLEGVRLRRQEEGGRAGHIGLALVAS